MVIQSKIVKIMKTNQGHSVKQTDIVSQTKEMCPMFKAQPAMIKAAIEFLMTNAYIRRDDKVRNEFWYIA